MCRQQLNAGFRVARKKGQTAFKYSQYAVTWLIIGNAHRINQGHMPDLSNKGNDFFLFAFDEPEEVASMIVELVTDRIPNRFGFDSRQDIQVVVPMYRGQVGAHVLNEQLQAHLTPPHPKRSERTLGGRVFRAGDKVMQTRNNYDLEVFNGDSGIIEQINLVEQQIHVSIDDRTVIYDWSDVNELTHAYAISVHRSQGSEYPVIVMPVVTQHYHKLLRNLLYTAITRARQVVVLVGTKKAIAIAVKNSRTQERYSGLVWRLKQQHDN